MSKTSKPNYSTRVNWDHCTEGWDGMAGPDEVTSIAARPAGTPEPFPSAAAITEAAMRA